MFEFDQSEMLPEQKLWCAVIERAFLDAFPPEDHWKRTHKGEHNVFEYNLNQARAWFSIHNKHFRTVCQYAGLDPEYILRLYREKLSGKRQSTWLDTRTIRKHAMRVVSIALLTLTVSACATQEPAPLRGEMMIPDVKACIAEYDGPGYVGTRADYVAGCYRFATVRF